MFRPTLLTAVRGAGEHPAVVDDYGTASYRDLDRWSDRIAHDLDVAACGHEPHCTVLLLPNSAAWVAGYLGVLKTGGTVAPLNAALTGAEVARILVTARPRTVLTTVERADEITALCEQLSLATRVQTPGPVPAPRADGTEPSMRTVPQEGRGKAVGDPGAACLIMHTSGSTGACKGVVQTGTALHLVADQWRQQHRLPTDVVAVPLPLAHTYGHVAAAATLLAGATLVVSSSNGPARWADLLADRRVTVVEAVPTMYTRLLRQPALAPGALPGLRSCITGGQGAPRVLREEWQRRTGVALVQNWGMTELSGPGLCADTGRPECLDSVGVPLPGLEVRLADPADPGAEVRSGGTGELWVRGPQVTPGYRVDSRQVTPATDGDGWLHTGDLVTRDEHGCVTIAGRCKDVIMTGGYTVQPAEVEDVLRAHPAVHDAAVLGRTCPERGEAPHALVVPHGTDPVPVDDLIAHCRNILARYKVPRTIGFVPVLPLTAVGKLDRAALRRLAAPSVMAAPAAPTVLEQP
ncbi:class I adenylate-forming enzyme family protein [Streptomyces olivoreticuli]